MAPHSSARRRHPLRRCPAALARLLLVATTAVLLAAPGSGGGGAPRGLGLPLPVRGPRLSRSGAPRSGVAAGRLTARRAEPGDKLLFKDLEVGQTLEGTVLRHMGTKKYIIDVGANKEGELKVAELRDGFPLQPLQAKQKVTVRVLSKDNERLWLTMRSGDLARPEWKKKGRRDEQDVTPFLGMEPEVWLDGEVTEMSLFAAWVKVRSPDGNAEAEGMVHKDNFCKSFLDEAAVSLPVRVRVARVDEEKKVMDLTMLDP